MKSPECSYFFNNCEPDDEEEYEKCVQLFALRCKVGAVFPG